MLSQTLSGESEFKENSNSNSLKRIICSSCPGRITGDAEACQRSARIDYLFIMSWADPVLGDSKSLERVLGTRPGRILCWVMSWEDPVLGSAPAAPSSRGPTGPCKGSGPLGPKPVLWVDLWPNARDLTAPGGARPERCGPGRALPLDPKRARRAPGLHSARPRPARFQTRNASGSRARSARPRRPGPKRSARPGPKRSARSGPKRSARSGPARFAQPPYSKGREAKRGPGARPSRMQ